jgi:spermidine synthase
VYLWNSLGTLLAPALVTFVLVPWKGVAGTWLVVGGVIGFAGIGFLRTTDAARQKSVPWIALPAAVLALVILRHPPRLFLPETHLLRRHPDRHLLAVKTDELTTASVIETGEGERILYTDDFAAAATGRHYRYMRLLGHLPALLAKRQENALVICFGTGTTAGAVAAHPGVKRLEVAEVSRAVLDLAPWFKDANRGVLDDPRTRVLVDDGRDALLLHQPDLDLITLEPLMPYSPAGLPFYTREFYGLARDRLREGGVVCQWVPVHAMPAAMFAALLRTFFEVFPDGDLWFFEQSVALTSGGAAPPALAERFGAVSQDLADAGYPTAALLGSALVAVGRTVLDAPAPDPQLARRTVTDLDPWPEFHATPRGVRTSYLLDTLVYLTTLADGMRSRATTPGSSALATRILDGGSDAPVSALRARVADAAADMAGTRIERLAHLEEASRLYAHALEDLPGEAALTWRRARAARAAAAIRVGDLNAKAKAARAAGRANDAFDLERAAAGYSLAALELPDGDPVAGQRSAAARLHALALLRLGRCAAAQRAVNDAASALVGTAEASLLREWATAIAIRKDGTGPTPQLPVDLPGCRPEGLESESVRSTFDSWKRALQRDDAPRAVRLAGTNLVHAAVAEDATDALLGALKGELWSETPRGKAHVATLRGRLGHDTTDLEILLASSVPAEVRAALDEAGELKLLHQVPEATLAPLRGHSDASVREALASALGGDPDDRGKRALVDLLADPERGVRAAAAAALVPHDPDDMKDYDPDGKPESWKRVQERLRKQR